MTEKPTARMRLQKYLSDAGVASRRRAEELILEGHVLVNGAVVETLPVLIDPAHDRVIVDGQPVRPQRLAYYVLNKPKGVVCTTRDPAGRLRVTDLLPPLPVRLFPVGRLDEESTGLLLMTNDGDLAQRISHPRYGIPKIYHAEVRGRVPRDLPARLKAGVFLAEGAAQATGVEVLHSSQQRSTLLITLRESRNRQVRRMLAKLGFPVRRLKRVQIGPLELRDLPMGAVRRLTTAEVAALRAAVERAVQRADRPRTTRPKPPPAARPAERLAAATKRKDTRPPPTPPTPRRRLIT